MKTVLRKWCEMNKATERTFISGFSCPFSRLYAASFLPLFFSLVLPLTRLVMAGWGCLLCCDGNRSPHVALYCPPFNMISALYQRKPIVSILSGLRIINDVQH